MFFPANLVACSICVIFLFGCGKSKTDERTAQREKGEALVKKYCSNCHLPVFAESLDKETWGKRVLPAMAARLGIEIYQGESFFAGPSSVLSLAEWNQILAYYDSLAPQKLEPAKLEFQPAKDWGPFRLRQPAGEFRETATAAMVKYDSLSGCIFTSSADISDLTQWSVALKKLSSVTLKSPAVDMLRNNQGEQIICSIGEMRAMDLPNGDISKYDNKHMLGTMAVGLKRPIQLAKSDFNKDGLEDFVVCSFGHEQGGLFLLQQIKDHSFKTVPIREIAGATQAITGDFNHDGWVDIVALFAHADEGIWLFENNKKGGFSEKKLLAFPPVYGSSRFQLADMNNDSHLDIVYTAGDNSDYSRILKPYHGIYIFQNQGSFEFKQTSFYPVNGSTKVIVADFNQDGLQDMASIAFFGDLINNRSETFLYFEQKKGVKTSPEFSIFSPPIAQYGRWICMDAGDIDHDGDIDILLGNFAKGFINQRRLKPYWELNVPFVVLENKSINRIATQK